MFAELNPYAAPQTPLTTAPLTQLVVQKSCLFSWALVREATCKGAAAGLIASLVMLFVFGLRMGEETRGELLHLLVICGWFSAVTSALGLLWGLSHAVILWCLQRLQPEAKSDS